MKKTILIFCALISACMLWATTTTTFTYGSHFKGQGTASPGSKVSAEVDGITITLNAAGALDSYTDHLRMFVSNTSYLTVDSEDPISKVVITCTASGTNQYGPGKLTNDTNVGNYSYSSYKGTWSIGENEEAPKQVKLRATAQCRIKEIEVYTEEQSEGPVAVKGVSLNKTTITLSVGGQEQLTAILNPDNADNKNVTWTAQNGNVSVENGLVTALTVGEDVVTVTTEDGNKTATCSVTVEQGQTLDDGATIFQKVTKAADIVAGKQYIIVYEDGKVAAGEWDTNRYNATPAKIKGNQATAPSATVFTLGGTTDAWTLQTDAGYLVITAADNGYLENNSEIAKTWKIGSTGGSLTSVDYSSRAIRFNNATIAGGGQRFTNYASTKQEGIQLYYRTEEIYSKPDVETVNLNKYVLNLRKGETEQLLAVVSPFGADETIVWTTNDESVASVADGLVSALKVGTATITATAVNSVNATCEVTITDSVHVTGIELNKTTLTLVEAGKETLTATITPADADNKEVIWETSDANIATVENGQITAMHYGEATITARSKDNSEITATCQVTITAKPGSRYAKVNTVEEIQVGDFVIFVCETDGKANGGFFYGDGTTHNKYLEAVDVTILHDTVITNDALEFELGKSDIYWTLTSKNRKLAKKDKGDYMDAANSAIATHTISIDSYAKVANTQLVDGVEFYIRYNNNSFRYYRSSSVVSDIQLYRLVERQELPIAVESVELDEETKNLRVGDNFTLHATITPADAKNKNIIWGTSAEDIATVENGVVNAIATGTAKIWVKTEDGEFTDTCYVTIRKSLNLPAVTWNIVQNLDSLKEGTKVIFGTKKSTANYAMGVYNIGSGQSNIKAVDATYGDQRHTITVSESYAYIVHKDNSHYYFEDIDGNYLYMYNTNKNLSSSTELSNKSKWTMTMGEDEFPTIRSVYSSSWKMLYNISGVFCTYSSQDNNMDEIYIYSNNAPEWIEPEKNPEIQINTSTLDWGKQEPDGYGEWYDSRKLTITAVDLSEGIFVSLDDATGTFSTYTSIIDKKAKNVELTIYWEATQKGTYTATLTLSSAGAESKVINLIAEAVGIEEVSPKLTLSTHSIYLNPNIDNNLDDISSFTFSVENLKKNLYIKWENGTYPPYEGEGLEILAGETELIYNSSANMGSDTRIDEEVIVEAFVFTPGTYVTTLCFYTPDANDKSQNAFEERVTITVFLDEEYKPTTALDNAEDKVESRKIIRNGQLLILRNGKTYTTTGTEF